MQPPLLPTMLVGSYAQPEWLMDRRKLAGRLPPAFDVRCRAVSGGGPDPHRHPGDPGPGGRRAGHRHRRRDAA